MGNIWFYYGDYGFLLNMSLCALRSLDIPKNAASISVGMRPSLKIKSFEIGHLVSA